MTCSTLTSSAGLAELFFCTFDMATGSRILTALLVFAFLIYVMYRAKIPFFAAMPISIFIIFVFAGAGVMDYAAAPVFTNLMWVIVMLFGAVVVLAIWRLKK